MYPSLKYSKLTELILKRVFAKFNSIFNMKFSLLFPFYSYYFEFHLSQNTLRLFISVSFLLFPMQLYYFSPFSHFRESFSASYEKQSSTAIKILLPERLAVHNSAYPLSAYPLMVKSTSIVLVKDISAQSDQNTE